MRRVLTCALFVLAACGETTAPEDVERPEEQLIFARYAPDAEPDVPSASFYAVRGEERSVIIRYQGSFPGDVPLLEFTVGANSLLTRPSGLPFFLRDSILITVRVDPTRRIMFDFQPVGLTFSPLDPALLRINYSGRDDDLNNDGRVNPLDDVLEAQLRIWQEAALGLPWLPVPTQRVTGEPILEGRITHFTRFALAS